jgi:CRISPR-associated endoribonuclease Cas6
MFLHVIEQVDPDLSERLHANAQYRPFTLSPLGIAGQRSVFQGFRLPAYRVLKSGTACYVRITLLEDTLFPVFAQYFLKRLEPTFQLGETEFAVTSLLATPENENTWSHYISYLDLIARASKENRKIKLWFVTPTSFSTGDVDLPLPLPRLMFQSYLRRFQEFYPEFTFLPDLAEQVEYHVGISNLNRLETAIIQAKRISLIGFVGEVTFEISKKAFPELIFQVNLLANFSFYCGTGKKTTMGMGQTVLLASS